MVQGTIYRPDSKSRVTVTAESGRFNIIHVYLGSTYYNNKLRVMKRILVIHACVSTRLY